MILSVRSRTSSLELSDTILFFMSVEIFIKDHMDENEVTTAADDIRTIYFSTSSASSSTVAPDIISIGVVTIFADSIARLSMKASCSLHEGCECFVTITKRDENHTSIEDVLLSLSGLAAGDGQMAGQGYERLMSRWRIVQGFESAI